MIRSVTIKGYRGLEHFEMDKLGRINLLVGKNNSGKSSVLEAVYLLASGGASQFFPALLDSRGEFLDHNPADVMSRGQIPRMSIFDVRHLFHGHEFKDNAKISIYSREHEPWQTIAIEIRNLQPEEIKRSSYEEEIRASREEFRALEVSAKKNDILHSTRSIHLVTVRGGLLTRLLSEISFAAWELPLLPFPNVQNFPGYLIALWNSITLTPNEDRVVEALQCVEPRIERIAVDVPTHPRTLSPRSGFKVKLNDQDKPLPIGSLGDGVWRMLAIAIMLVVSRDSVLLIDEIDTGLHYSVLEKLWHMVMKTAKDLNVQVFATTHSYDCVTSLASICRAEPEAMSEVTIQRVEAGKRKAVAYDESGIVMAAERHIEMR
jgi:hypothetical protein